MAILALLGGAAAAITTGIVAFILVSPVLWILYKLHVVTDEGGPWAAMVINIPIAFLCGVISFIYCFRKLLNYGNSPE